MHPRARSADGGAARGEGRVRAGRHRTDCSGAAGAEVLRGRCPGKGTCSLDMLVAG